MASTQNHFYGHSSVLARYAGFSGTRRIGGYLQHGWANWQPFVNQREVHTRVVPKLVWTERDAGFCREQGMSPVRIVGSPWLYLLEMTGPLPTAPSRTLLAFPHHSLGTVSRHEMLAAQGRYAEELAGLSEYSHVTICLYPADWTDREVVEVFASRGLTPTTCGGRSDPQFLDRLWNLLAAHAAVTANRVGSSVLYAASGGRRTFFARFSAELQRRRRGSVSVRR